MALTQDQLTELADHGITEAEYNALPAHEQLALITETPDDRTSVSDEDAIAANAARAAALAATPAPTEAPKPTEAPAASPVPSPAPTATPTPTPAPGADPEDTPAATAAPVATPAPTAAPAAAPAAPQWRAVTTEQDPLGFEAPVFAPPPQLVSEADKAKIGEVRTKLDELTDKFTDGEITASDFKAQKGVLEEQLVDLQGRQSAQIGLDAQHHQNVVQAFNQALDGVFAATKAAGFDYRAKENEGALQALDGALKRYAQAAPLMHPDRSAVWRDRWALAQAHNEVASKHGIAWKAGAPGAPQTPAATEAPRPAPRSAPDLSQVPPTTRGAPNAADMSIAADEFAALDKMTPAEAEAAVARFDDATMQRYLAR